ncbi:MAG: glycine cleavage system protein GcvH [Hyphomicrobiales bacterium]|nr:glycine cleavage system protein GcvH [Hyphomicrobiales bacterium]MCP5371073.1 glycine cleavage system protein GcvH [Hyphomicrobiales bacterium]
MSDTYYTRDHEWIRVDGDIGTVGISEYAQEQLGDVVFVELPEPGKAFDQGDEAAVVESVKAASEIYAPITGAVVEANGDLDDDPSKVNADAEGDGWFFRMTVADPAELEDMMDGNAYKAYVAELDD